MDFSHRHRFDAGLTDVSAMLADEGFALERGRASGATECDALVDGEAAGEFTVSIRRVVPASTIPAEFRSFVGSNLNVKYTEAWEATEGSERRGTFAVEIAGTPGHAAGSLLLTETDDGTDFALDGSVEAHVPLFGSVIERAVTAAVDKAFTHELAAADAWLARA